MARYLMRWLTNFYDFRFKWTATLAIEIHPTGKNTRTNRIWFTIQDHTTAGEQKSQDSKSIKWKISHLEDNEHVNLMENDTIPNHEITKLDELEKLSDFGTYNKVENHGQKTILTRWVISSKEGTSKAGLVANNFEENKFIMTVWQ